MKRFNLCYIRVPKAASSSIMEYFYKNICDTKTDIISHGITNYPERLSFINCPKLKHSHVDAKFSIDELNVPNNAKFIGVVRHPLERQISLYLFRIRNDVYKCGKHDMPTHFRSKLINGELQDRQAHQKKHQHTFLEYKEPINSEWWIYERVEQHLMDLMKEYKIEQKVNFGYLNKSTQSLGKSKELIDVLYDDNTKKLAEKAFEKDIDLYYERKKYYDELYS